MSSRRTSAKARRTLFTVLLAVMGLVLLLEAQVDAGQHRHVTTAAAEASCVSCLLVQTPAQAVLPPVVVPAPLERPFEPPVASQGIAAVHRRWHWPRSQAPPHA
jgi:hypothetical protein